MIFSISFEVDEFEVAGYSSEELSKSSGWLENESSSSGAVSQTKFPREEK